MEDRDLGRCSEYTDVIGLNPYTCIRHTATYLGPSRGLYANERPMVSCTVLLVSGRSGIDRLQVYLSPVVLEVDLWCETIKAGRKVGVEVLA